MSKRTFFSIAINVLFATWGCVFAQTATLTGDVQDSSGAVIPQVKIRATNVGTNLNFDATTDGMGAYVLSHLPIGAYTVTAEKTGFKGFRQNQIILTVDSKMLLNIQMQVGSNTETVTVDADALQIDTVTPTLQQTINNQRIMDMPLNGRDLYQLTGLVAGTTGASSEMPHINGGRSDSRATTVDVRLDGMTNVDTDVQTVMPAPPPDAVQEFTVQTSLPSAQYQYSNGAVDVATKSGTNTFHGTVYDFLRNDKLDALNYFARSKTKLHRNQYGASVGGPVWLPHVYNGRNRTFWFFDFEQQKEPLTTVKTIFVPTPAQLSGVFTTTIKDPTTGQPFPNNTIPSQRISPLALNLVKTYVPAAQDSTGKYTYNAPGGANPLQFLARIDHTLGKNQFMYRLYTVNESDPAITYDGNLPSWQSAELNIIQSQVHTGSWTRTFSSSAINTFHFSLNSYVNGQLASPSHPKVTPSDLSNFGWSDNFVNGVKQDNEGYLPKVAITSYMTFGTDTPNDTYHSTTYNYYDDFNLHRGRNDLYFGGQVQRAYQSDNLQAIRAMGYFSLTGQFTGNPLADFLLGLPSSFQEQNSQLGVNTHTSLALYAQDNIKVNSRLGVQLGLRYDLPFVPTNANGTQNLAEVFRPGSTQQSKVYLNAPPGLLFYGDPGVNSGGVDLDAREFGPRIGFSYALTADARTTLRAGYGIYYNPNYTNLDAQTNNKQPFVNRITLSPAPSLADPWQGYSGGNPFPYTPTDAKNFVFSNAQLFSFAPNFRNANSQQWNINLQQQFHKDYLFTLAYVGVKGTHLFLHTDLNAARYIPGNDPATGKPLSTTANLNNRRPFYPPATSIDWGMPAGNSEYHAMQVTLDKRYSHGLTLLAVYTWSKSIDEGSNGFGGSFPQTPYNENFLEGERSVSSYDVRNIVASSAVFEIPSPTQQRFANELLGGWILSGMLRIGGGTPLGMTSSLDNALRGLTDRPNKVGNPQLSSDRSTSAKLAQWFDTTAYAVNGMGQFGNAPRYDDHVRSPGYAILDAGLLKNFRVTEFQKVQFRSEFFNLPNHPNFNAPATNISAPASFGKITSAGSARIIQLALRYIF